MYHRLNEISGPQMEQLKQAQDYLIRLGDELVELKKLAP
jgi:hypothetical protein